MVRKVEELDFSLAQRSRMPTKSKILIKRNDKILINKPTEGFRPRSLDNSRRAGENFVPPKIFVRGRPFQASERSAAASVSRIEAKASAAASPILDHDSRTGPTGTNPFPLALLRGTCRREPETDQ